LAIDASGFLYVADAGNHRIQKFRRPAVITSVADIPGDQGRQVRLRFIADAADLAASAIPIIRYDVFRRISASPSAGEARAPVSAPGTARGARAPSALAPPRVEVDGWDFVGTLSAYADSAYNLVVPTLADSNSSGLHASVFFVRAATATPSVYFDSAPDTGWSVDNLPPAPPAPFTGAYVAGATHLHWGRNSEPDLWYYRLYAEVPRRSCRALPISSQTPPTPATSIRGPLETRTSSPRWT
jgi:hypothetical protein